MKKAKQPCSIYNLFFQLERECLLHEYIPTRSQDILREISKSCKKGQNINESRDHDQRPLRYRHLTLPDNWFKSGRSKRKHRKTNLPFNFLQLNEIISKRWELVDEETKAYLKKIASSEWKIYRANHKKSLDHNITKTTEKEKNNNIDGKNNMASGSLKHGYDPFSTCKSHLEIKTTSSFTKKQFNSFSGNMNSNCGCEKTNRLLLPQKSCLSPLFLTSNTFNLPVNAEASTNYPDLNRHLSIPQLQQEHKFVESMNNSMFNAQRENNHSSMPVFRQRTCYMSPFNAQINDIKNGSCKQKSDFQDDNFHQFQQEGSRTWLVDNADYNPMASCKESKSNDSQKLLSFVQDLVTIQSSLCRVVDCMQSHNASMQHDTFMFQPRDQKLQINVQDQFQCLPVANELGLYCDQNQCSPVNSTYSTWNTSCNQNQTVVSPRTLTPREKCRQFSFSYHNGLSFWHDFECSNNGIPNNNLDEHETDSFSWIGNPFSVGLESEETEMDDCDFPPGSFHPVDDSLAFHPNEGPYGISR